MSLKKRISNNLGYIIVLTSNILVMALGFAINILATNVMNPNDFGFYRAFITAIMMFAGFSNFGFHYTYSRLFALSNDQNQKKKMGASAIVIYVLLSVLLIIGTHAFAYFSKYFWGIIFPEYVTLSSIFVFVFLFSYYLQQKLQGESKINRYSLLSLVPQLILALFFAALFFSGEQATYPLVIAFFLFSKIIVIGFLLLEDGVDFKNCFNNINDVVKSNSSYGLQLYIGSLFSVAAAHALSLLIAGVSGLDEYAFFTLGISLASPVLFIPSTMGIVKFGKNVKSANLPKKEIAITIGVTVAAAGFYFLILNFFINKIISKNYFKAIPYANIFIIYYSFMGLGDYFNKYITAKGEGISIRNNSIITGITLLLFALLLIPKYSINGLIISKIISSIIYLFLMLKAYLKIINKRS